jgi:integrase
MRGGIATGKLTDKAIKAFVVKAEIGRKLADGGGLYLFITQAGNPTWRIKYRLDGKEKVYSIGPYPLISLAAARLEWGEVKAKILAGKDPVDSRRLARVSHATAGGHTVELVAADWLTMKRKEWSETHHVKSARAFERDVFPLLGKLPISAVTPAMVATVIQKIQNRDVLETASRILQHLNGVFRYAQAKGLCRDNPAAPVKEILPRKKNGGHMPALLDWPSLGDVLRRAELARLSNSVHLAHRLCAFTAARIGNIVEAEWSEFHLDDEQPTWIIPRSKMKVVSRAIDHRIPLCAQIAEEMRQWQTMTRLQKNLYVFTSPTGARHIGRESVEKVYRVTLGLAGKHSPHGWRSAFSTLARDNGFERDVVELALDHAHDDEVVRAYDRGERFVQRIRLYRW